MVLRHSQTRAYQPDPRRAQHAGPPPTQPTTPQPPNPPKRQIRDANLDNRLSISAGSQLASAPASAEEQGFRPITYGAVTADGPAGLACGELHDSRGSTPLTRFHADAVLTTPGSARRDGVRFDLSSDAMSFAASRGLTGKESVCWRGPAPNPRFRRSRRRRKRGQRGLEPSGRRSEAALSGGASWA